MTFPFEGTPPLPEDDYFNASATAYEDDEFEDADEDD